MRSPSSCTDTALGLGSSEPGAVPDVLQDMGNLLLKIDCWGEDMVSEDQVREILQGGLGTLSVVNRPEWPTP
jgi:hypothetical protein